MKMMTMSGSMENNNATTTSLYEAEASAHRLLAWEGLGFDSADLGRRARELEWRVAIGGGGGGGGVDKTSGMGNISSSRRRRSSTDNRWDDDDEEKEKKSGGILSFDGMNNYDDNDQEPHPPPHSQPMTLEERGCAGLRCGDANAANFVLKQFSSVGGVGSSYQRITSGNIHIYQPCPSTTLCQFR
jgi:hypothetical protein